MLFVVVTFGLEAQLRSSRSDYWEIIAKSSDIHIINSNDLKKNLEDMESSVRNGYYYYQVPVVEMLKGTEVETIKIYVYLEQEFIDHVKLLPDTTKLVVFFIKLYAAFRLSGQDEISNYITEGNYHEGIVVYTDRIYREITGEIAKQQLIQHKKLYEAFTRDETLDRKIKGLIDELTVPERELAAFDEIIMIGPNAVPYIILHMDDYRELPIKNVTIINDNPDAWEGWVNYGPDLVIDALEIILSELTATNFGYTYNGGTNEERQRILDGWRIYLYYLIYSNLTQG
jgi:hypothetical protein